MEARSAYDYYKEENKLKIDKTKTIEENLQTMQTKLEKIDDIESKLEKIDEILGKIRKYLKSNKDSKQQL